MINFLTIELLSYDSKGLFSLLKYHLLYKKTVFTRIQTGLGVGAPSEHLSHLKLLMLVSFTPVLLLMESNLVFDYVVCNVVIVIVDGA